MSLFASNRRALTPLLATTSFQLTVDCVHAALQLVLETWRAGVTAVHIQARQLPTSTRVATIPYRLPAVSS